LHTESQLHKRVRGKLLEGSGRKSPANKPTKAMVNRGRKTNPLPRRGKRKREQERAAKITPPSPKVITLSQKESRRGREGGGQYLLKERQKVRARKKTSHPEQKKRSGSRRKKVPDPPPRAPLLEGRADLPYHSSGRGVGKGDIRQSKKITLSPPIAY